ncbi:TetR/AcrR family transcriptional regulator [Paenibacillus sp. N1-5-1-14]|uniref:TetR/AcrR family transcriptional regulator n=1 Tax=Paenibacillus radicibacter TaxID=2972488 RepID=UPI002158EB8D|nr:TetR/AcrR family transcriptional regulator [Paenibacillus radicibacter]MCR8643399.1 TetR/AcrR family transcriptional regulator [Paenibacillus radicibacter]
MRHKDENKSEAIFRATIQLLNEIGFSDTSMSKIAKRANVSPSTIYVYFENKEDMLGKLYLNVKKKLSLIMLAGLDESVSVRAGLELVIRNYLSYTLEHKEDFLFIEQFCNSPIIEKLNLEDAKLMFQPFFQLIERGKKEKLIKDCDLMLLLVYIQTPLTEMVKLHLKGEFEFTETNIKHMVQMCWGAIKA